MKTATISSLRVAPELREAAEGILEEGETLSSFVEEAIKKSISARQAQQAFIARGLLSRDEARRNHEYYPASDVLNELDKMLTAAESRAKEH